MKFSSWVLVGMAFLFITACGQYGALYLPDQHKADQLKAGVQKQ